MSNVADYRDYQDEQRTLRDLLARDRTVLANERTILAYARTSIMLLVSTVTLLKLFPDSQAALWLGIALVPLAAIVGCMGLTRYLRLSRALKSLTRK